MTYYGQLNIIGKITVLIKSVRSQGGKHISHRFLDLVDQLAIKLHKLAQISKQHFQTYYTNCFNKLQNTVSIMMVCNMPRTNPDEQY